MRKQALVLIGWMVLFGPFCVATRHQPPPGPLPGPTMPDAGEETQGLDAAVVASSTTPDAVADAPESPCDVMRATWDLTQSSDRYQSHLAELPMEEAIRRYYLRKVLARGIDERSFASHPVVFKRLGTAPGVAVAGCVEEWRAVDPTGIVPDEPPRFAADHHYAEVTFEFNDASDGENAYSAFVDVATMQVVVMFHYNNFQP
jgi:hypothetical protein